MTQKQALLEICNAVCRGLPEGYTLKLCLEHGAGWVELVAPDMENIIPLDFGVDTDMDDQLANAVAFAKGHAKTHDWGL